MTTPKGHHDVFRRVGMSWSRSHSRSSLGMREPWSSERELKRLLWVGLVYLFAPYLSVLKPYAAGKTHWRLEWCEPDEEVRWGEAKSTPHHVNVIEDVFPHAWSILRASGLTEPFEIRRVEMIDPWSVRLRLAAGQA